MSKVERILDARIDLQSVVDRPNEGWQARYCTAIDRIAVWYKITPAELADAYMQHFMAGLPKKAQP